VVVATFLEATMSVTTNHNLPPKKPARRLRQPFEKVVLVAFGLAFCWKGIATLQLPERGLPKHQAEPVKNTNYNEPIYYCDNNATHPACCSADHCQLVRNSTLYSACCGNVLSPQEYYPMLLPLLITGAPRSGTVFMKNLLTELGLQVTDDQTSPREDGIVSWMHIVQDRFGYFGGAALHGSKFQIVWHQVRDPLQTLTSIAFTEPLNQMDYASGSPAYLRFLRRHIKITKFQRFIQKIHEQKATERKERRKQGILYRLWQSPRFHPPQPVPTLSELQNDHLIYSAMEFYLHWQHMILDLQIRRYQLEEIVQRQNLTILDEIFQSIGRTPPNHEQVRTVLSRKRRRRRLQAIDTNRREHRDTLKWSELCRVDVELAQQFLDMSHTFGYYLQKEKACLSLPVGMPLPS
jgi:hypothetical protein